MEGRQEGILLSQAWVAVFYQVQECRQHLSLITELLMLLARGARFRLHLVAEHGQSQLPSQPPIPCN